MDNKADYMAFKMVAGENYEMVFEKCKDIATRCLEIMQYDAKEAEFEEFVLAGNKIIEEKYALKNEDGEIILDENDCYTLVTKPDLSELKEKYADVIATYEKGKKKIMKYMNGKVELKLKTFPLTLVPANVTGSYLNAIKCMLEA